MDIKGHVLMLCKQLLSSINMAIHLVLSNSKRIFWGNEKALSYNSYLLQLRKAYKHVFLGMKTNVEFH